MIATGSSSAPPRLEALENIDCLTNRDIFSLERLPATFIVLGGGPIAVEMAQAFNRLGSRVLLVQRSGQILSREDADMADTVMAAMADEGVKFFLNTTVTDARQEGDEKIITVVSGDGRTMELRGDAVLLAQGRTGNLTGLGLESLGMERTGGFLAVDNRMRTSLHHIYAPGDINGRFQFTHAAGYEGGIVVANAIFHLPRKADYTWMPWCTYTDPELASIGMNEKSAAKAGIEVRVWREDFQANDRAVTEARTRAVSSWFWTAEKGSSGCR
ncbi:hypothetical protein GF1_29040 [Desulfolithobacter dissulfuricans]|uniref:Mercuric reductase n=1 Tax=Desulfolithobacter dissulfuricans TaxID=2795293 RepID=A0A915XLC9_9BACT|nr:hypothetical protein GF1_29040 [Desulfolithobacter dissulfuricans]